MNCSVRGFRFDDRYEPDKRVRAYRFVKLDEPGTTSYLHGIYIQTSLIKQEPDKQVRQAETSLIDRFVESEYPVQSDVVGARSTRS
ncbi:unnamed protein product [Sphagnum balticum]